MPMRRFSAGTKQSGPDTVKSSTAIIPASGRSSPAMQRRSVVFPHPDGPSRASTVPAGTSRSMPRSTGFPPSTRSTPRVLSADPRGSLRPGTAGHISIWGGRFSIATSHGSAMRAVSAMTIAQNRRPVTR